MLLNTKLPLSLAARASRKTVRRVQQYSKCQVLREQVPPLQASPSTETGVSKGETGVETLPKHKMHLDALSDYRTSTFTPVPRRILDGSEDGSAIPAAVVSGAPLELQARTVRIYKPVKPATQSGTWHNDAWLMDWDPLPKGHRWENPLMGWQSTADFMQGERIGFPSKEAAIRFAENQGYEYFVQEPNTRKVKVKAYASNFLYVPGKLKTVRTK